MWLIRPLETLEREHLAQARGKAVRLGWLLRRGLSVPPGLCVGAEAYRRFLREGDSDRSSTR